MCKPAALRPVNQNINSLIMKSQIIKSFLLSCALVALPQAFGAKGTELQIPLADDAHVVVHYVDMIPTLSSGGLAPDGAETDRRNDLEGVLKKSFEKAGLKINLEVVPFGSQKTGDIDLTITITQWDVNPMGDYECRISASVTNGEQEYDLGNFSGRYSGMVTSSSRATVAYEKAAAKAVDQVVAHFFRA